MKQTIFNFKDRFAADVASGKKKTTIRLFAKTTPPAKGDQLKHFTGMRTKKCRKIKEAICRDCCPILITENVILLNDLWLNPTDENQLAVNDGFKNAAELRAFFRQTYGFPLPGNPHLVSWS